MNTMFVLVKIYKREEILGVSQFTMHLEDLVEDVKWLYGDFWATPRDEVVRHTTINDLPRYEIRRVNFYE